MARIDDTTDTVQYTLTGDWPGGGTITVSYPPGRGPGDYGGGRNHKVISNSHMPLFDYNGTAKFVFGATDITITNGTGRTISGGTPLYIELDRAGRDVTGDPVADESMAELRLFKVALGTPDTADPDGAVESQSATAAGGLATGINGTLASGGVATFDVPRNVVASWTGTAVLTVTGTDQYGATVVESSGSGTSMTGKKAFKTVTGISVSADVTALTVGTGVVLGLPAFLESAADVLAEYEDGAAASAGTVVPGDTATATATTGDVRGTYDPASAPNGSRAFAILAGFKSAGYRGIAQFAG